MADIDLYAAFGLDRTASSDELARSLSYQLASAGPANPALAEQIATARAILGDPQHRAAYDTQLTDPSAPAITPDTLQQLAGGSPAPAAAGASPLVRVLGIIAALLVVAVVIVAVLVVRHSSDESGPVAAPLPSENTSATNGLDPSGSAPTQPGPNQSPGPTPPVEGAYAGAGGSRPVGAIPLPTYVSRYGKLTSAHLLTPTGGIGCDFNESDSDGKQGLCGIISFNKPSSPLGCVTRAGNCKGRWVFPFADNQVGDATDSSGTTGWMNQPANDGYQVPRVEYGKQYYFQDWVCASEMNGLTCWNTSTGSGVFLSNEKAEAFDGPGHATPAPQEQSGDESIVLGSMPSNGTGFGTAQPVEVYAGGSPTSMVKGITWKDWGRDRAEGTGMGNYPIPGVGIESNVPVVVVAFEPGSCQGKRAYMKLAIYHPSKDETFNPSSAMNACWDR